MKIINIRNITIFIILFMSIFVFEMAACALFPIKEKKHDLLNRYQEWIIQTIDIEKPKIKKVIKEGKKLNADKIIIGTSKSQAKLAIFSKKFLEDLNVVLTYPDDNVKDVAIVNSKYNELVYVKDGKDYINYRGNAYLVIGTFFEQKDDTLKEDMFFINADSSEVKNDNCYDYIQLSFEENIDIENIERCSQKLFDDYYITDNINSCYIDTRVSFFLIILICACLVMFNCVGFIQKWLQYQKKELLIRKMVGATRKNNVSLLYKRFFYINILSAITGSFITMIVLLFIKHFPDLSSSRELFGTRLSVWSVFSSFIIVLVIGNIILGLNMHANGKYELIKEV